MRRKTRIRKRKQKRVRSLTRKLSGGTVHENVKKAQENHSKNTNIVKKGNEVSFMSKHHLGDNLFNLKFLFDISPILKEKGIKVKYYYEPHYVKNVEELKRYVNPEVMTLETIQNAPKNATQLWMGDTVDGAPRYTPVDVYFPKFYAMMLEKMGLKDSGIDTSLYQKEPYLEEIYQKLDPKFKDLDILIINAEPQSGQFVYHKLLFEKMCKKLSTKYKVAITSPIDDDTSIPCTFKDKLLLQDIGAISTHANYIIAVNSGPLVACYTHATKEHVKKWIIFVDEPFKHTQLNSIALKNTYDYRHIEEHLN